jgi:hypothetical protein
LPNGLKKTVHQNRLLKIAREGRQMTPQDLGRFEPSRRYTTLSALVLELEATIIDEIIELNDRIIGSVINYPAASSGVVYYQYVTNVINPLRVDPLCF